MTDEQASPDQSQGDGLTTVRSDFGPAETLGRLEAAINAGGMRIFARIDHAALAAEAGMVLRPTEVMIFGNPRGGTPLMQAGQTIGLDLPLKVLVWEDASGTTHLSYNEPAFLAARHGVGTQASVAKLSSVMNDLARRVTRSAPGSGQPNELQRPAPEAFNRKFLL